MQGSEFLLADSRQGLTAYRSGIFTTEQAAPMIRRELVKQSGPRDWEWSAS